MHSASRPLVRFPEGLHPGERGSGAGLRRQDHVQRDPLAGHKKAQRTKLMTPDRRTWAQAKSRPARAVTRLSRPDKQADLPAGKPESPKRIQDAHGERQLSRSQFKEENVIIAVDHTNLHQAAVIHSISWKESHRSFCAPDFVKMHTPERQQEYIRNKMNCGSRFFMLIEDKPVGVVSVKECLIEDLYRLDGLVLGRQQSPHR